MSKARGLADLGNAYSDGALSNRNLIINGAMQVAQRGTSSTGVTASGYFAADRFKIGLDSQGTHTITQASDGPAGFAKSYKIAVTTADAAPTGGDNFGLDQRFEGQNLQMLKKGTADAESVTLSFWVKSNKTGTYNVEFEDITNARNIIAAYTVDVSGTWEYKTITFAGDTSGALIADSSLRARVLWWLGSGSIFSSGTRNTSWAATVNANRAVGNVNLSATIGNYFQITGVQLEVGDTATPFEHRSFGQELDACQRYFEKTYNYGVALGTATQAGKSSYVCSNYLSGSVIYGSNTYYRVLKRSSPSLSFWSHSGVANQWHEGVAGASEVLHAAPLLSSAGEVGFQPYMTTVGSIVNTMYGHWAADAEL
jgi:hypothetical protein